MGASDKSAFSMLAYRNLVAFGFGDRTVVALRNITWWSQVTRTPLGDDLESLEVNPLLVDGATIEALDAVVTWKVIQT